MATLPIRKLILYKQGIGYFTRRGAIDEQTIALVIPRRATNDVLKSLNVQVEGDGRVLSVDYETPTTGETSDTSISLAERSSLVDLLTSLRGTEVTLQLDGTMTTGRIIGVETLNDVDDGQASLLLQNTDGEQVTMHPLDTVIGFTLHDPKAQRDVGFYLDISQTETTRMTLTVRVSEDVNTLAINYLTPSPVWRVSYRLVASGDGQARLVGWGLFDNSIGEDLENVDLTLMSGRPISFEYLLNESKNVPRPQVADDADIMQSFSTNPQVMAAFRTISHDLRSPLSSIATSIYLLSEVKGSLTDEQKRIVDIIQSSADNLNSMVENLLDIVNLRTEEHDEYSRRTDTYGTSPLGDLKVSSGYFVPMQMGNANSEHMVYDVENPVSVRRGQSAMVPIIDTTISYDELLVYNRDKMPNHPLRVWQFTNTTGLALEQGPVTIADEQYHGDGLLRFTGVDDEIQIPYALHFGIIISEKTTRDDDTIFAFEVDVEKRRLFVHYEQISHVEYSISSRVDDDNTLLIEWRNPRSAEFVDMPDPVMEQDQHTRWQVNVGAGVETAFTVNFRIESRRLLEMRNLKQSFVDELQEGDFISDNLHTLLSVYCNEKDTQADAKTDIDSLQDEYNQVVSRQAQLRENIKTLGTSDRETAIRDRILDDLETSENRRRDIEDQIERRTAQIEESKTAQTVTVNAIFAE